MIRVATPPRSFQASSTPIVETTRSASRAARSGSPAAATASASISITSGRRRSRLRAADRLDRAAGGQRPALPPQRLGQQRARFVELLQPTLAGRLEPGDQPQQDPLREAVEARAELRARQGEVVRDEIDDLERGVPARRRRR